jgi:hypothetical protein
MVVAALDTVIIHKASPTEAFKRFLLLLGGAAGIRTTGSSPPCRRSSATFVHWRSGSVPGYGSRHTGLLPHGNPLRTVKPPLTQVAYPMETELSASFGPLGSRVQQPAHLRDPSYLARHANFQHHPPFH